MLTRMPWLEQVASGGQRHPHDASLGSRVGDLANLPVVGRDRGGVDAHAPFAVLQRLRGDHRCGSEAQHVEGADQVDLDGGLKRQQRVRAARARKLLGPADAGAAHGDAQPAIRRRGLLYGRLHLALLAHVAGYELDAELGGERGALLGVDVGDRDDRALLVQASHGSLAETRGAADDDC